MIGSRLRRRRRIVRIKAIKSRSHSDETYSEPTEGTLYNATWQPATNQPTDDQFGTYTEITDIFFFEQLSNGNLPAITRGYVLIDENNNRYDVEDIAKQGGEENRLKVETKRLKWPV